MGQLDNTIVVFTTDNGAETITFPDGGTTPFKGGKLTTWEGGMRAPMVVRWPGHIEPGTVKNEIFASLDWVPTFVEIAGGPKGDGLKKQIEAGQYPGHRQDHARRRRPARLPGRQVGKVGARYFFYYSGKQPSAVRYKNWKMYFAMVSAIAGGLHHGRDALSLDPGRQHQARSVRDCGRGAGEDLVRHRPAPSPDRSPPTSTTGTCCRSARRCG